MSSNTQSNGAPERNGTPQYSGTKELGSNIALFVLCFVLLLGCLYTLGMYPEGGWVWWMVAVLLYGVTFLIPLWILPSKTNERVHTGGSDLFLK